MSPAGKSPAAYLTPLDPNDAPLPVVLGLSGFVLTDDEKELFRIAKPLGFILFLRNCRDPAQVSALVQSLHDVSGRNVPVLIDQEGGRVQRLGPPHWPAVASAKTLARDIGRNFVRSKEIIQKHVKELTLGLYQTGINVNCAPVMDVLFPATHDAIGDRAYASDPETVGILGALVCEAMIDQGVIPIVKHMPGQGRAESDSHKNLPVVTASLAELQAADFVPYKKLLTLALSEGVWGMVAHVVYGALDPAQPASCSRRIIWDVIRHAIGFKGFLVSDDICMDALASYGTASRRVEAALRGGCDAVLHCNGNIGEMRQIAAGTQKMTAEAVARYNRSISWYKASVA